MRDVGNTFMGLNLGDRALTNVAAENRRAYRERPRESDTNGNDTAADERAARDRRNELPRDAQNAHNGRESRNTRRAGNTDDDDDTDADTYNDLPAAHGADQARDRRLKDKDAAKKLKQYSWPLYDHFSTAVSFRRAFNLQIERAKDEGISPEMIANSISNHFIKDGKIAQKFGNLAKSHDTKTLAGVVKVINNLTPGDDSLSAEDKFRSLQMLKNENELDYMQRLSASHDDYFPDVKGKLMKVKDQFLENFKHGDCSLNDREKEVLGAYGDMNELAIKAKKTIQTRMAAKNKSKESLDINAIDETQKQAKAKQYAPGAQQPNVQYPPMVSQPIPIPATTLPQMQQMTQAPPPYAMAQHPMQMTQTQQPIMQQPQMQQPQMQQPQMQQPQMQQQQMQQPQQQFQQGFTRRPAIKRPLEVPFKDRVPAAADAQRASFGEVQAGRSEDGIPFCYNCYMKTGHNANQCRTISYCHICQKEAGHTTRLHGSYPPRQEPRREAMTSL